MCFRPEDAGRLVFDNAITNQGCIRVFRNPSAPQQARLLIFGDSFGTNLAIAFSGVFAEVTYAYRPAGFDPVLARLVEPDYVLLEITQRFLHGLPDIDSSIYGTIAGKLRAMPPAAQAALLERWRAAPPEFQPLLRPALDRAGG